ncbi:Nuclear transport factor 2 [Senna tora]|uniref:Nuclear transport factor 2 n=1 Tax=Senna tora TaxID=362788 RepID=A0A834SSF5_9FABA|nr:Nuclear transport factor 2 [Senna tora]
MLLAGKLKIAVNEDEHGGRGRVGGLAIDGDDVVSAIKPKGFKVLLNGCKVSS